MAFEEGHHARGGAINLCDQGGSGVDLGGEAGDVARVNGGQGGGAGEGGAQREGEGGGGIDGGGAEDDIALGRGVFGERVYHHIGVGQDIDV